MADMDKRPRPYIPLRVRLQVARRQLEAVGITHDRSEALAHALRLLFGNDPCHLDHNPPLRARPYNPRIKDVAARYTPNANDPEYLIYRTKHEHHIKTNVRGDGAQHPDRVLIKRERRREKDRKSVV